MEGLSEALPCFVRREHVSGVDLILPHAISHAESGYWPPVKRQYIDAETGDVVEPDEQVKGYEIAKDEHILVEEEELEKIPLEATHTIDIDSFAEAGEVDVRLSR